MDTARISIKDIARHLGKHHSTVSRALRNDPSISEETRRSVAKTNRELGYLPDPRLSELMTRVQKGPRQAIDDTIAVTVPPAESELGRNDVVCAILDAAVEGILGYGYKVERFVHEKEGHKSIFVCLTDPVFACPRERYLAACNLPIESGAVVTVVASAGSSERSRRDALRMATKSAATALLLDDLERFRKLSSAKCGKDLFLIGNLHESIPGFQLPLKESETEFL